MLFDKLKRREFITLFGRAAAAWPLSARAQQRAIPVIGLLSSRSPAADTPFIAVIRQGLNETGLVEGQTSPSTIVGLRVNTIDWRDSPPISCVSK
jgi:hypothetical protein